MSGRFVLKQFTLLDPQRPVLAHDEEVNALMKIRMHSAQSDLPNIAPVVDVQVLRPSAQPGLHAFVVTPYYPLGDLAAYLKRMACPTYSPKEAVALSLHTMKGLDYAHRRLGLVHNDVKPGNIVLEEVEGELCVRLIDWGLSGAQAGGTPFYAPPERWRGDWEALESELTDVYGVAATIYWMLTGKAPLADIVENEVLPKTEWREFLCKGVRSTPVSRWNPAVPAVLTDLIARWLDPASDKRVSNVYGDFVQHGKGKGAMGCALRELEEVASACGYSSSLTDVGLSEFLTEPMIDLSDQSGAASRPQSGGSLR